ncbi:hypothetical protein BG57_21340 [Caballeronia grimmiae]|uniref:Uncharacterized protein n=2 Tax=Caballeronia grimmiae TaxID=1071679 RepID=A0A069P752_9BURK|nr:hypothetical protein BG57_21340 [Caballeronia grimmiae]
MRPMDTSALDTSFEITCRKVTNQLLFASSVAFLILVMFVIYMRFTGPLTGPTRCAGLTFALICQVLAALAMLSYVWSAIPTLWNFQRYGARRLNAEFEHDSQNAMQLTSFDRSHLEGADRYVQSFIDRQRTFVEAFVGPMTNVALFSLVGLAVSVYKEFTSDHPLPFNNYVQYGMAFLGGIAFGAVLLNRVLRRYSYLRDVLALALSNKGSFDMNV